MIEDIPSLEHHSRIYLACTTAAICEHEVRVLFSS